MSSKDKPLPLSGTLSDLALLRASNLDLSSLLPQAAAARADERTAPTAEQASVERSYEFAGEARAALKILARGDVGKEGARAENLKSRFEELQQGLEGQ